eukprot:1198985-Pyramimonas_sp.AAC.1
MFSSARALTAHLRVMGRAQPFLWRKQCGNWAFNFRIIANGGKCAKCNNIVDLFKRSGPSSSPKKPPWAKGSPPPEDPAVLLQKLASIPALAWAHRALVDLETTRAAPLVKQRAPQQEANYTAQNLQKKEAALRRAADGQVAAEAVLERAEDNALAATEEAVAAREANDKAIEA